MILALSLAVAAGAGVPARSYDCTTVDAAGRRDAFSVIVNASGEPVSLGGNFSLADPDMKLLERIGSYQGTRLRISKGGKDYLVTLRGTFGGTTAAILIEEGLGDAWPYQKARYSGLCVASPNAVDPALVSLPAVSTEKFRWVFWFVRLAGPKSKIAEVSWRSRCTVLNARGEQSQIGIEVRLSDKRLSGDATSAASLTLTGTSGAMPTAEYKGTFSQSMAQEHGSKKPGVLTLSVMTNLGVKRDNAYATVLMRDGGGDLSQQIILATGGNVVASGFCDPLNLKQTFGSEQPR